MQDLSAALGRQGRVRSPWTAMVTRLPGLTESAYREAEGVVADHPGRGACGVNAGITITEPAVPAGAPAPRLTPGIQRAGTTKAGGDGGEGVIADHAGRGSGEVVARIAITEPAAIPAVTPAPRLTPGIQRAGTTRVGGDGGEGVVAHHAGRGAGAVSAGIAITETAGLPSPQHHA